MQLHRAETFKLSTDLLLIEKVSGLAGLYLNPPDRTLVLCAEANSQLLTFDRTQRNLQMMPGVAEWRRHDYSRHGTTTLFAVLS